MLRIYVYLMLFVPIFLVTSYVYLDKRLLERARKYKKIKYRLRRK